LQSNDPGPRRLIVGDMTQINDAVAHARQWAAPAWRRWRRQPAEPRRGVDSRRCP